MAKSLTSVAIPYEVTAPQQLNTDLFKVLPAFFFSLSFFCFCLFCDTRRNNCNLVQVLDLSLSLFRVSLAWLTMSLVVEITIQSQRSKEKGAKRLLHEFAGGK